MNRAILLLTALILSSGCLEGQYFVGDDDPQDATVIPPILILVNYQAQLITIQGAESSARWDNITVELSPSCHHDTPATGRMVPGQVIHFTAAPSSTATECTFTALYDGYELDSWVFTIPANMEDP